MSVASSDAGQSTAPEPDVVRPGWHHFLAGEIGGAVGITLSFPFDTVKTRLQMSQKLAHASVDGIGASSSALERPPNTFASIGRIITQEGLGGLFKGVAFPIVAYGMVTSTMFGLNGIMTDRLLQYRNHQRASSGEPFIVDSSKLPVMDVLLAAQVSAFVASFPRTMMERIKVWSQIHGTNTITSLITLYRQYGVVYGWFSGVTPMLLRELPQGVFYFPVYEFVCRQLAPDVQDKRQMSKFHIWLAGATAGVAQWVATYPIDTAKTRMQAAPPNTYKGTLHCMKSIVQEHGSIYPLYRGLAPTCYRAATLASTLFLLYESILDWIHDHTVYEDDE